MGTEFTTIANTVRQSINIYNMFKTKCFEVRKPQTLECLKKFLAPAVFKIK